MTVFFSYSVLFSIINFNPLHPNISMHMVSSQLADGPTRRYQLADANSPMPTRRRIKSSRDVGELVLNPIQLIRS